MTTSCNRAPIALFAYNRVDLTRRTVETLAANHGAAESDLTIFSDGPRDESDQVRIDEVRAFIVGVRGFRRIKVIESPSNRGLAASIIAGVTALVEEHGRVIVVEDDLITSPAFLDFMNDALEMYRNEPLVGAISGYTFPLNARLPETFFLREESCWGWATWKRAWAKFEPDGRKLLLELESSGQTREFDLDASFPFTQMLRDQIAGKNNSWAIRWRASLFLNQMLSLYPGGSLVRNIGTDGSGTHARTSDTAYDTDIRLAPVQVRPIAITANAGVRRELKRYFRKNFAHGLWPRALRRIRRMVNQT